MKNVLKRRNILFFRKAYYIARVSWYEHVLIIYLILGDG